MTKCISKEDIRLGDKIRVTFKERNGVTTIKRGVVGTNDLDSDWFAETKEGDLGDYLTFMRGVGVSSIELLQRPLPSEPGTVFRATEIRGEKCDVVVLVREVFNYHDSSPAPVYSITAWEPLYG